MEYAGMGRRAMAAFIEVVLLFVIAYVIALVTGNTTEGGFELTGWFALVPFVVWFVYYVGMEAAAGATIGKLLLGLRVVKADGSPLDWRSALIRNVSRVVDGIAFYLVGAILAWNSEQRQRLGDRLASTVVVRN